MKFFTDEVYRAAEDDHAPILAAHERYKAHITTLAGRLPESVVRLSDPFLVNDALLASVSQTEEPNRMELTWRCGHLQIGYFDLRLIYEEVEIDSRDLALIAVIAQKAEDSTSFYAMDLRLQELDVLSDGLIEHRMALHTEDWFAIRCQKMSAERIDRPDRYLPPYTDRYRIDRFGLDSSLAGVPSKCD